MSLAFAAKVTSLNNFQTNHEFVSVLTFAAVLLKFGDNVCVNDKSPEAQTLLNFLGNPNKFENR